MLDKKSLAELEQRFESLVANGHVHREDTPKLPFIYRVSQGPGRENLGEGRKRYDSRVIQWEKW